MSVDKSCYYLNGFMIHQSTPVSSQLAPLGSSAKSLGPSVDLLGTVGSSYSALLGTEQKGFMMVLELKKRIIHSKFTTYQIISIESHKSRDS